jgi:hypothetical protein
MKMCSAFSLPPLRHNTATWRSFDGSPQHALERAGQYGERK